VTIQVKGSPFLWADILGALSALFPWLAIGVILIVVYFLLTTVPGWVWGILFLGAAAIIVAPIFMPMFTSTTKAVQKGIKQVSPAKKKELPPSQAEIERVQRYLKGKR
jgi:membrane-bound ClpP family serine protease